mgnify:CR=1 FL=1
MLWIKSGIENPSKSEVIGRCGGVEKKRQKSNAKKKYIKKSSFSKNCLLSFFESRVM